MWGYRLPSGAQDVCTSWSGSLALALQGFFGATFSQLLSHLYAGCVQHVIWGSQD